jgi:hypothetical protein
MKLIHPTGEEALACLRAMRKSSIWRWISRRSVRSAGGVTPRAAANSCSRAKAAE